jgi:hypothetical protein
MLDAIYLCTTLSINENALCYSFIPFLNLIVIFLLL